MDVTLNAVDWGKLTEFKPIESFFDHLFEVEEEPDWMLSGPDYGWVCDSHSLYSETVWVLDQLKQHVDTKTQHLINDGISPLISENSQLDELGTGQVTDFCWWISVTPESTQNIYESLKQIDFKYLAETLHRHPSDGSQDLTPFDQEEVIGFIKQHLAIVEIATQHGYGLLGHVG